MRSPRSSAARLGALFATSFVALVFTSACTSERGFELDISSSVPVPPEVVGWELRLIQLDAASGCPSVDEAATAARFGRLAHAQSFTDVGMSVGEIPAGRWAMAVIGRQDACTVSLYGCSVVNIGSDTFSPISIRVEPVTTTEACGCRTCTAGACDPVASICD